MSAADQTDNKPIITRFAPSPTGALHVGGARTALFAWAFARNPKNPPGSKFILRLEDTDRARSSVESARSIIRDLQWLGIDWDEGPSPNADDDPYDRTKQIGNNGPYAQSQRNEDGIYQQRIDELLEKGLAYKDDDAVRFRMDKPVAFDDAVYGRIEVTEDNLEDFIIQKGAAGAFYPTFHFAVVVDDALMGVTHVLRGQEHLTNTTKHVALQDALGFDRPVYAHMPSIMNPDGSKMSKRDKAKAARKAFGDYSIKVGESGSFDLVLEGRGAAGRHLLDADSLKSFVDGESDDNQIASRIADILHISLPEIEVVDFRRSGYLPNVLCNYISLLGWNPGDNVERFDVKFLSENFSLERINKANSKFDREKLVAFNGDTIQQSLSPDEFADQLREFAERTEHGEIVRELGDQFARFAAAFQIRSKTLADPFIQGGFLFAEDDEIEYRDFDSKPVRKAMLKNDGEGFAALEILRYKLADLLDNGFGEAAHELIKSLAEGEGVSMGKYAQPLRVAVSGGTVTPPIDATLEILGKASTLARIEHCLNNRPDNVGPGLPGH